MDGRKPILDRPSAIILPELADQFRQLIAQLHPDARGLLLAELQSPRETQTRQQRRENRVRPLVAIRQDELVKLLDVCVPLKPGRAWKLTASRLRAAMVILDRTGIRAGELLDLVESDLYPDDGTILIRHGKGDKQRIVGMDAWGWREVEQWLELRNAEIPRGRLLPTIMGPAAGGPWMDCALRRELAVAAKRAGLGHTAHPHSWRHGCTVRLRAEGVDLVTIQAQLGHADLSTTALYLASIDPRDRVKPVIDRPAPMIELPHRPLRAT